MAVAWFEHEAIKQLGIHAIEHGRNVQDILAEATKNWSAQHGLVRCDAEG